MCEVSIHASGPSEAENNLCCALSHAKLGFGSRGQKELFLKCQILAACWVNEKVLKIKKR